MSHNTFGSRRERGESRKDSLRWDFGRKSFKGSREEGLQIFC